MRRTSLLVTFLRVQVMNDLQYRANFVVQLLQSVLALAAGLTTMLLVYQHVPSLNGWSQADLMALLGVFTLVGGLLRMLVRPNLYQLAYDINQGSLDYVLTKPVNTQLFVSTRRVELAQGIDVLTGGCLVTWGVAVSGRGPSVVDVVLFLVTLTLGVFILYCFLFCIITTAFWLVEVEEIVELFDSVYQTGRWPMVIYPGWLRFVLTFVVPVGFAVTLSAEAITSRMSPLALLAELVVAAIAFLITNRLFAAGVKRYAGASA